MRLVWLLDPVRRTATIYAPDRTARMLPGHEALDGGEAAPGVTMPAAGLFV